MNKHTVEMLGRLRDLGLRSDDAIALRRIAMTLHRWHELECGTDNGWASVCIARGRKSRPVDVATGARRIEFDYDDNGKPYLEVHPNNGAATQYWPTPDRERGALKRLAAIMARYPQFASYVQTDPRGASLYIIDKATTPQPYDQFYSRGIAVHK